MFIPRYLFSESIPTVLSGSHHLLWMYCLQNHVNSVWLQPHVTSRGYTWWQFCWNKMYRWTDRKTVWGHRWTYQLGIFLKQSTAFAENSNLNRWSWIIISASDTKYENYLLLPVQIKWKLCTLLSRGIITKYHYRHTLLAVEIWNWTHFARWNRESAGRRVNIDCSGLCTEQHWDTLTSPS